MKDDISDIAAFYDQDPEIEHQRLERHQLEFELSLRFLDDFLLREGSLLEIGAATGRYTLALAERGFSITAVDLSPEQIKYCRRNLEDAGLVSYVDFLVADARDLSGIEKTDYDAVLLMGPLYHLVEESDRIRALEQAYQKMKTGGRIFTTFISRYGIMGDLMRNIPDWIEKQEDVRSMLTFGRDPDNYPKGNFRGYFAETSEIIPLHESVGFITEKLVGIEPAISADDESYNSLEGRQRRLWLNLLYEISAEKSLIGASRHLLYIGRKR